MIRRFQLTWQPSCIDVTGLATGHPSRAKVRALLISKVAEGLCCTAWWQRLVVPPDTFTRMSGLEAGCCMVLGLTAQQVADCVDIQGAQWSPGQVRSAGAGDPGPANVRPK